MPKIDYMCTTSFHNVRKTKGQASINTRRLSLGVGCVHSAIDAVILHTYSTATIIEDSLQSLEQHKMWKIE